MDLGLRDSRTVVTGAGANIGRGITHVLAREGARILLVDIDRDSVDRVTQEALTLGATEAVGLAQDLTLDGAGNRVVDRAVALWGGVDSLVNNAGWSKPGWFAEQTDRALWQRTVDINMLAAVDCTQAALAQMRD